MTPRDSFRAAILAAAVVAAGIFLCDAGAADAQTLPAIPPARATPAAAHAGGDTTPLEDQRKILDAVKPALVVVEYSLRYDKSSPPTMAGASPYDTDLADLVEQERPYLQPGLLIDDTHVVTPDVAIPARFVQEIAVRAYINAAGTAGHSSHSDLNRHASVVNSSVTREAHITAYPKHQKAVILTLAAPLPGIAHAAAFDGTSDDDLSTVTFDPSSHLGSVNIAGFQDSLLLRNGTSVFETAFGPVINKHGQFVGFVTGLDLPSDGAGSLWKGNPLKWDAYSAADMTALLGRVASAAARGIIPVTLNFRSPKSTPADPSSFGPSSGDASNATVQHVLGLVRDAHTVLILAELKPSVTARLQRIRLDIPSSAAGTPGQPAGGTVEAHFKGSLRYFGAFVATVEQPLTGFAAWSDAPVQSLEGETLPTAIITLEGEKRVAYFAPRRISDFERGWRGAIYPSFSNDPHSFFLFSPAGQLAVAPVNHRAQSGMRQGYSGPMSIDSGEAIETPVSQLAAALADLPAATDPGNVPLTEQQANQVAWIGIELQPLTQELARAHGVSDQTNDGDSGAVVTYVYPDSPAAKAGVQPGWIALRIDAPDQPRPINIHVDGYDPFSGEAFPWDRLDQAPVDAFDRIPTPWPPEKNAFSRALTDLGFGSHCVIEFYHDGKIDRQSFTVAAGPANYQNAPKYKQPALGMTVKDLTFEVRRYLQKKPDDPGVVISKIETGSKADIAGLKPFEVITHVNDQPVNNVADFERLTQHQTEVRLSVKRVMKGRIVKISMGAEHPVAATQGE